MRTEPDRISHLAYPCFDAAKTLRFYTRVMRFRLLRAADGVSPEWGGKRYCMIAFGCDAGEIHFFALAGMRRPAADGLPKDIRHVALRVASRAAVDAWRRRLRANRVRYVVEDHHGLTSVYFSDPNGIMFEITAAGGDSVAEAAAARQVIRRWTARRIA